MKGSRKRTDNKGAAARSLSAFINTCTGNGILPYTGNGIWKNRKD